MFLHPLKSPPLHPPIPSFPPRQYSTPLIATPTHLLPSNPPHKHTHDPTLSTHLHLYLILTHLSTYTNGTQFRQKLSHAKHISTASHTTGSKTRVLALTAQRSTYTPGTQDTLARYAVHLDETTSRLDERIRRLEDEIRWSAQLAAQSEYQYATSAHDATTT
jgi:hypothetical protein